MNRTIKKNTLKPNATIVLFYTDNQVPQMMRLEVNNL